MGRGNSTAVEVVTAAVRRDANRIVAHDPLVRLRATVGDNDSAVHQMRVGCRRLRSDLRTFTSLLDTEWSDPLDAEVAWLADVLGRARDVEVLRARLPHTAAEDPLAPLDAVALTGMDALLADNEAAALGVVDATLVSERYRALLGVLAAAFNPQFRDRARDAGPKTVLYLIAKPWRRLVQAASHLNSAAPDAVWHRARIRTKHARYALQALTGIQVAKLERALADVQTNLGEHQDAVTAAAAWAALAAVDPVRWGVTAGRLIERERILARAARAAFPALWHVANSRKLTRWLP